MPSTKNATNRIRKSRREGMQGVEAMEAPTRRGTAKIKKTAGASDLPAELPDNGSRQATGLVSKRKARRKPEKTARRGSKHAPHGTHRSQTRPGGAWDGKTPRAHGAVIQRRRALNRFQRGLRAARLVGNGITVIARWQAWRRNRVTES